jgi:hypothetical protein
MSQRVNRVLLVASSGQLGASGLGSVRLAVCWVPEVFRNGHSAQNGAVICRTRALCRWAQRTGGHRNGSASSPRTGLRGRRVDGRAPRLAARCATGFGCAERRVLTEKRGGAGRSPDWSRTRRRRPPRSSAGLSERSQLGRGSDGGIDRRRGLAAGTGFGDARFAASVHPKPRTPCNCSVHGSCAHRLPVGRGVPRAAA